MSNKKIAFEIEILGHSETVQNLSEVEIALDKVKFQRNQLKKAYTDGLISEKEYTEQLTKLIAESKVLQKQKQDLNRELKEQKKQADLNVGSMSHFRTEIAKLQKELNNHVRGVSISEKAYDELYKSVAKGKKEIIDFDQGLNDGRSNVGRYKDSLLDLVGEFGEFGGILANLGSGLGKGLAIGAAVTGVIAIGKAVNDVVKEFGAFRDEVALLSGATGDELDNIVTQVDSIGNTYGKSQQDILDATNKLVQQYKGTVNEVTFDEALASIESGFQRGADASGKLLDIIKEYPAQYKEAGLSVQDFVDAATANELLGFYNDKGVDAVKEFGLAIREQGKAQEEAMQKAFGVEFADEFFKNINDGTTTTGESIEVFVNKIRESNLPVKEQQKLIADLFKGAGEDAAILSEIGLQYLETITDMRNGTLELTKEQQAYLDRTNALKEANDRLSVAKNELTKRLQDESGAFQNLQVEAQAFLIETLNELIDAFSPLIDTFGELFGTIGEYMDLLFDTGEATSDMSDEGTILGDIFEIVAGVLTFVVDVFNEMLNAVIWGIEEIPILGKAFDFLGAYVRNLVNLFKNLPSIFKGVIAAAFQMKDNIINAFKDIVLQLQILKLEAEKFNPFGDASAKIDKEIAALKKKRKDIAKQGKSVGDAFADAYNESVENIKTDKAIASSNRDKNEAERAARDKAQKTKTEREKAAKEAEREAERTAKAAEKERLQQEKEAEKEAERQRKEAEKLASDLEKIKRQAIEEDLKNLEDGIEKEKQLQANRFFNEIADLQNQLIDKEDLSENEIKFNEQINLLIEAKQVEHRNKLSEIDKKYEDKAKAETEKTFDFKNKKLDNEYNLQVDVAEKTISNEEQLAAAKTQIAIDVANKKVQLIRSEIEATGKATETQIAQLRELQSTVNELQKPQSGNSSFVDKGNDLQGKINQGINDGIGDVFGLDEENTAAFKSQVSGLASEVYSSITDAKAAEIERQLANDLEYYESRKNGELEALEAKKEAGLISESEYQSGKEAIEMRSEIMMERSRQKAFEQERQLKTRMAVIQGIMAILNALATVPFPANLAAAASVGVKTAFEVAAIKKAEKGMYLNKGRLHPQGGELVEIERGEAVINRRALASSDVINLSGTPLQIADALNTYKGTGVSFLQSAGITTTNGKLPSLSQGGFNGRAPATLTPRYIQEQKIQEYNFTKIADIIGAKVAKEVNDKKVVVTTKDITDKQNQRAEVINNSKFLT